MKLDNESNIVIHTENEFKNEKSGLLASKVLDYIVLCSAWMYNRKS